MSTVDGAAALAPSAPPVRGAGVRPPATRSPSSLLRFIAGMRALFALLTGIALFIEGLGASPWLLVVVGPYLILAAGVLLRTLTGSPDAGAQRWLWADAFVVAVLCRLLEHQAAWLGVIGVVPVVAMSVLAGPRHGLAMALASAAAMLVPGPAEWRSGEWVNVPLAVPLGILAFGPAAAFLAMPSRELRQRLQLLDDFNAASDPRQGLLHHVDVLLGLLIVHFRLDAAVVSLQGPEPRIFRREPGRPTRLLDEAESVRWRAGRTALPDDVACISSHTGGPRVVGVAIDAMACGDTVDVDPIASRTLLDLAPESVALPLMSYGRPLGHLCLKRRTGVFGVSDLRWLHDAMREVLPLLERCDLLEQLQRETARVERERIGRDLHDSAVQPYLGLKYGLEALARRAGPDNPLAPIIHQLVELTTQELQTLRDVVAGLRKGGHPAATTAFMQSLHRQGARFEALYGLKVRIVAHRPVHLRGNVAHAVLHMFNEALTNVRRHTAATTVVVVVEADAQHLRVGVRNDHGARSMPGAPFVPRSLSERASEFGGNVTVDVHPQSTEVTIELPLLGATA